MIKSLFYIGCLLFILSLGSVVLFTLPSITDSFNLTSDGTANIGTTISGITSPILNVISIYFLYVAFTKQQEANDIQRNRNDVDLAFRLLDDVNTELNNFTITETKQATNTSTTFKGTIGLFRYCKPFYDNPNRYKLFTQQYESDIIVSILVSYDLMVQKFVGAQLPLDIAKQFFNAKLKVPLAYIVNAHILEQDEMAVKIRNFYNKFSDEPITEIDLTLSQEL